MLAAITAAVGFLIAVLWFDLMFDVQVWPHRRADLLPEPVTESIATYYRRVTTDASPMNRLVALVMVVLLALLIGQATGDGTPTWLSIVSLTLAALAIGLALGRVVPAAKRLGNHPDSQRATTALARSIFRDHVLFLSLMVGLLVLQLVGG